MQNAVLILFALVAVSHPQPTDGQSVAVTGTVVFVCEHGAVKSVVAAAIFNQLAADRGLPFRAISRGTDPDAAVPAPVRDGLRSEGLAVDSRFSPARVAPADVGSAKRVIVFDVPTPAGATERSTARWDGMPAFSDGYGAASAAIRARVELLLRDLQAGK